MKKCSNSCSIKNLKTQYRTYLNNFRSNFSTSLPSSESKTDTSGFSILNAWSKSGLHTSVQLKHNSLDLMIALDIGFCPEQILQANHVFVTHGHTDHIGGIFAHARARALRKNPANYYVPLQIQDTLLQGKALFESLGGSYIPFQVHGIQPGDIIELIPNALSVKVFETSHQGSSQGYSFIRHLSTGDDVVELSYIGDSLLESLKKEDTLWKAKKIIMELTYLDGSIDKTKHGDHCHIQDIVDHAERFSCDELIFCHFSSKYQNCSQVLELMRNGLPEKLIPKTHACLHSFGFAGPTTSLQQFVNGNLTRDCTDNLDDENVNGNNNGDNRK